MQTHESFGLVRVGVAVPRTKVADCKHNADRIIKLMEKAEASRISVLVFPELSITGYTCADLFQQIPLRKAALEALSEIAIASRKFKGLTLVGMPIAANDQLFNCAVAVQNGKVLAVIPKSFIPNYKEFYERRWFSPAENSGVSEIQINGESVPFGTDILLAARELKELLVGVEICEDLWVPIPPSSFQALAGATLLLNLSASNELIGKAGYRKQLVSNQSGRCVAAYAYCSSGTGESSTDLVFSGHCMIAENGSILCENQRFEQDDVLLFSDIDCERLEIDRLRANSFGDNKRGSYGQKDFRLIPFSTGRKTAVENLSREIDAHPFVPRGKERLDERCHEIFQIQVSALTKRLESVPNANLTIGVSGGLDSTLSLLLLCKTADALGIPRKRIKAITMPGFGTTSRTKGNAGKLMKHLGVESDEIDIKPLCFEELKALKHKPFGINIEKLSLEKFIEKLSDLQEGSQDLVFENVQARMRTSLLMNSGFVIGTGDLSELALGWCTYNADHMSMYNPNASIPKTLVKFLVEWAAENQFDSDARRVLKDIVATEISPELLPAGKDGKIAQKTEASIGPYELNDFFLFYLLRFGMSPTKIHYLAKQAKFDKYYSEKEISSCLKLFLKRFFANQFKRSCLPDGPKVGSVSLSPRGDWRMPSDAELSSWLNWSEDGEMGSNNKQDSSANKSNGKRALGLVDPLNGFASKDFSDGNGHFAELPVEGGEEVGPPIGELQEKGNYDFCFAGVDEHPVDMFNFASQCKGKTPYIDKVKDRDGDLAIVYPDHCQKGSWSAAFLPGVRVDLIDQIFPKGVERDKDSHSVCGNKDLVPRLKELGITQVDLVGLVFRICVGFSAIDLAKAGFKVRVITDCTRDLDLAEFAFVIDEMKKLGVEMVQSKELLAAARN